MAGAHLPEEDQVQRGRRQETRCRFCLLSTVGRLYHPAHTRQQEVFTFTYNMYMYLHNYEHTHLLSYCQLTYFLKKVLAAVGLHSSVRGGCQAAAELNWQGGCWKAGQDEQGDARRASPGGQLASDPDSGGDSTRAVCDQPQEMAQPSCGRRWWRWGHGPAFLLLTLESKVNTQ